MNRLVLTEVSEVQLKARAWFGRAERDNNAPLDKDVYDSDDFSEIDDDDELPASLLAIGNGVKVAIVRPRNFQDAATIGEYSRQETPIIINLEDMSNPEAWRILDFVSGLILGLGGDIERVSRRTFLVVPVGATILTTHNSLTEESFFNQALRPVNDGPILLSSPCDVFALKVTRGAVSPGPAGPPGPGSRPAG
jgi:cell division inhibitor SepF